MTNIQDNVKNALEAGVVADAFLNQGMIDAMQEGGRLFKKSDCFFSELLMSAKTMQSGLKILEPYLVNSGVEWCEHNYGCQYGFLRFTRPQIWYSYTYGDGDPSRGVLSDHESIGCRN